MFPFSFNSSSQDTRLSVIATDVNYRQNFTAADNSRSTQLSSIHSIINMIVSAVTQTHHNKDVYVVFLWIYESDWPKHILNWFCIKTNN